MPLRKRVFDVIGLLLISPIAIPLTALTAMSVRLVLGSPILFRQKRPGLGGTPFYIYKFRTMTEARDEHGRLLADEARLGRFGRVLRAISLDELPELVNVLKGEMSLVGPRPLLMEYLERYSPDQFRRHEVPPGITGWAQVNGRNAITWEEKFEHDTWYADNWSLKLDAKILCMTLWKVWRREGISQPGRATADFFWGTRGPENSKREAGKLSKLQH